MARRAAYNALRATEATRDRDVRRADERNLYDERRAYMRRESCVVTLPFYRGVARVMVVRNDATPLTPPSATRGETRCCRCVHLEGVPKGNTSPLGTPVGAPHHRSFGWRSRYSRGKIGAAPLSPGPPPPAFYIQAGGQAPLAPQPPSEFRRIRSGSRAFGMIAQARILSNSTEFRLRDRVYSTCVPCTTEKDGVQRRIQGRGLHT